MLVFVLCLPFCSAHTFSCILRWELVFSDAISQRKACGARNHINVQPHFLSQSKPELIVFWHNCDLPSSLNQRLVAPVSCIWVSGYGLEESLPLPGVLWHRILLSPICVSSFMPWSVCLHSPGHYPLMHPHPSVKDQMQACPLGAGEPQWAGLPSSNSKTRVLSAKKRQKV